MNKRLLIVFIIFVVIILITLIFFIKQSKNSTNDTINDKNIHNIKKIPQILENNKSYKYYDLAYKNKLDIPVLYINLDRSKERKEYMETQFNIFDITNKTHIPAVDGNNLTSYNYTKIKDYDMSNSEIGCLLSHIKAIKHAHDNNMDNVLILEDDINLCLIPLWGKKISEIIKKAPSNWGIIQLFTMNKKCNTFDNQFLLHQPLNPCYSTAAYIINKKGMKDVLNYVGTNNQLGKYINGMLHPHSGIADRFIYELTTSYYYTTPLFIVSDELLQSTIHNSHCQGHIKHSNFILETYGKFNKINYSDIEKQYKFSKTLLDFDDFLKSFNVPYFLMHGTVLGIIREGKFISHDDDIDTGVLLENFNHDVIHGNKHFKLKHHYGSVETGCELTFKHLETNINVDIFIVYTVDNVNDPYKWTCSFKGKCDKAKYKMCRWKLPNFNVTPLTFIDRIFFIPSPVEDCLVAKYGPNWNIPKKYNYYEGINKGLYRGLIQSDFDVKDRVYFTEEKKISDLYPTKINSLSKPIIWLYWQNDENTKKPGYLDLCLKSIYQNCSKNFHIFLLDDNTVEIISRTIHKNFRNITPIGMRADYIRFTLISEYGGIWFDCDTAVIGDISFMINDLKTYNFVGFAHDHPADISIGMFAGNKNNQVCLYFKYLFEFYEKFCKWKTKKVKLPWTGPTKLAILYMKDLILMYPNAYKTYKATETVYPIHWKDSKEYYWNNGIIDDYILNMPFICFHNATYTDENKNIPADILLTKKYRISDFFNKILN